MKPLNEQINPKIVTQAKKLSKFKRLLQGILPVECLNHVEVANIRNQNLMLITDSPVWTTRLRQLSPQILQYIHDNRQSDDTGPEVIHHVQISTRYQKADNEQMQSSRKKNRPKLQISKKTAEMLSQSANSISHQKLKAALLKMAGHASASTEQPDTKQSEAERSDPGNHDETDK